MPEVLEGFQRRLPDVRQLAKDITCAGILVKLFPVDNSNRTLWIVGSPDTINWTPSKFEDVQEANARANASHAANAGSASKPKVKAKVSGQKAGRQKEQSSLAKGERNVAERRAQEGHSESDDTSNEQEEEEQEEEEEETEEEEEEDDAGEDDVGEDEDLEEQDGNEYNKVSGGIRTEEAGEREDEEHGGGKDLAEHIGKEGEQEAEGQSSAEEQQEAETGEREGEDVTEEEIEPHSTTRGGDCAVSDGGEQEHRGELKAGKEQEDQDQDQGVEDDMWQRVTVNNHDGPWKSWKTGDTRGEKDEERCTNAAEEERTATDENRCDEETRKRALEEDEAMDNLLLEKRPEKRSKSERGENGDDATTRDSFAQGLETPPQPRTPSPMSSTLSPGSTIKIVRQTSVVPGLEDTENAVWDAAQRDAIFTSLSEAHQKILVCTA
jgi:hypothetical protein